MKHSMNSGRIPIAAVALGVMVLIAASCMAPEDKSIVVASTTSTQDSGLFDYLLPIFSNAIGYDDVEHVRNTLFDAGSLTRPYHSVNTDINKRIRYLQARPDLSDAEIAHAALRDEAGS